jgi:hypothetical protein
MVNRAVVCAAAVTTADTFCQRRWEKPGEVKPLLPLGETVCMSGSWPEGHWHVYVMCFRATPHTAQRLVLKTIRV